MSHDLSIPKSLNGILSDTQRESWMNAWDATTHYEQQIMQEDINKMDRWLKQSVSIAAAEDLGLKAEIGFILHSVDKPFAWYISGLSEDGQQVYGVREDIYTHIGTILQRNLCDVVREADLIFMGPDGKQLRDVFTHAAYADPTRRNVGRSVLRIGTESKPCITASTRLNHSTVKQPSMQNEPVIPEKLHLFLSEHQRMSWIESWQSATPYIRKVMQDDINDMGRWLNNPTAINTAKDAGLKAKVGMILHSSKTSVAWYITGVSRDYSQVYGVREDNATHFGQLLQRSLQGVLHEADTVFTGNSHIQLRDIFVQTAYANQDHTVTGKSVTRIGVQVKPSQSIACKHAFK